MSSYDPKSLSSVYQIPTKAPFPILKETITDVDHALEGSPTEFVTLNVSSEFTKRTAPVTAFETSAKISYCVDAAGQPLLASIGTDKRLYLLAHVSGGPQGWQLQDISPGLINSTVVAFDFASFNGKLYLAAAVEIDGGNSQVYACSLDNLSLTYDANARVVKPDMKSSLVWHAIKNDLGDKIISSLKLGPADTNISALTHSSDYQISVGTQETSQLSGAHYVVDPSDGAPQAWRLIPMPETTHRVLEIDTANTWDGVGSFILYDRGDGIGCTQEIIDKSGNWVQPLGNIRLLTASLGTAKSMSVLQNIEGKTDLLIAGDKGLGFFDGRRLTEKPQIILPNVPFVQVTASEDIDPANINTQSIISLFALSAANELFFIRGIRTFSDNVIKFASSGLPIRTSIWRMSCAYNPLSGSHELVYATNGSNTLQHLVKDTHTGVWNETTICVPATGKTYTYPCFTTSVTCTNGSNVFAPARYPLTISSEAVQAVINGSTYNLSSKQTTVYTDGNGRIQIFIQADESLGAPILTIGCTEFVDKPQTFPITVNQRVIRALAGMQSRDDIMDSKNSLGQPVFPTLKDEDGKVSSTSGMLQRFPAMVNHVDSSAATQTLPPGSDVKQSPSVTIEKKDDGHYSLTGCDWFDAAVHAVEEFAHDVFEWLKGAARTVLRIGFRVLAEVLEFAVEVEGKLIKIVIKTIGTLVRSLVNFLKDTLGIDLSGLLNWLGFIFDVDEIKKTQKVLLNLIDGGMDVSMRFLKVNRSTVADEIEHIRDMIKPYIKDSRPPSQPTDSKSDGGIFSKILNNPIVHMLLSSSPTRELVDFIVETAEDSLSDVIKLPNSDDLLSIFTQDIPDLINDEIDNLKRLFDDILEKIKQCLSQPKKCADILLSLFGDIFWTVFDGAAALFTHGYDIMIKMVSQIFHVLRDTIKIPFLTTLFEVFAEQDFSIVNCFTFIVAGIMNIVYAIKDRKLPFDVLGDPSWFWKSVTDDTLDLHPLIGLHAAPPVVQPTRLAVMSRAAVSSNKTTLAAATATTENNDDEQKIYEETKDLYEKLEWIPDAIGTISVAINTDLVIGILAKITKKPATDAEGKSLMITLIPDCISIGAAFLSRIADFVLWRVMCDKSKLLNDELGAQNNQAMLVGLLLPTIMTVPSIFPCIMRRDPAGRNLSMGLLCFVDIPYEACCVFAQHPSGGRATTGALRMLGDAAGLVALVSSVAAEENPVVVISAGIATVSTIAATIADLATLGEK